MHLNHVVNICMELGTNSSLLKQATLEEVL